MTTYCDITNREPTEPFKQVAITRSLHASRMADAGVTLSSNLKPIAL
jgi:hypothetical protein